MDRIVFVVFTHKQKCGESQPFSFGHKNFDVTSEIVLALIDLFWFCSQWVDDSTVTSCRTRNPFSLCRVRARPPLMFSIG
jgi:hypothetical protein